MVYHTKGLGEIKKESKDEVPILQGYGYTIHRDNQY